MDQKFASISMGGVLTNEHVSITADIYAVMEDIIPMRLISNI